MKAYSAVSSLMVKTDKSWTAPWLSLTKRTVKDSGNTACVGVVSYHGGEWCHWWDGSVYRQIPTHYHIGIKGYPFFFITNACAYHVPFRDRKKYATFSRSSDRVGYWIHFLAKKSRKRGRLFQDYSRAWLQRHWVSVIMCFSSCDKFVFDARSRLLCVVLLTLGYLCFWTLRFTPFNHVKITSLCSVAP